MTASGVDATKRDARDLDDASPHPSATDPAESMSEHRRPSNGFSTVLLSAAVFAALVACYFLAGRTGFLVHENVPDSSFTALAIRFAVSLFVAGIAINGFFFTPGAPARSAVVGAVAVAALAAAYVAFWAWVASAFHFGYNWPLALTYLWVFSAHMFPLIAPAPVLLDLWRRERARSKRRSNPKVSATLVVAVAFSASTLPFLVY